LTIDPRHADALADAGLSADSIFKDPRIVVWRDLPERQNATLDFQSPPGTPRRWHIKRYLQASADPLAAEVRGIQLLQQANIPTVPLVAHGSDSLGRSFLITEDLRGFAAGDQVPPELLRQRLDDIVKLAADLHQAQLHHRDLYVCHFFLPEHPGRPHLIDAGRVARLPRLLPGRWIIKDIAQLLYSLHTCGVADQGPRALTLYTHLRQLHFPRIFRALVLHKVRRIARHDHRLRQRQPQRNVSLQS
jgi:hypothetical protein